MLKQYIMRLRKRRSCKTIVIKYVALIVSIYLLLSIMGLLFMESPANVSESSRFKQLAVEKLPAIPFNSHDHISCEKIHVAFTLFDARRGKDLVQMLKTLFHFRSNPLVFHIVTDHNGEHIFSTLFNTWEIPAADVRFYIYNKKVGNGDLAVLQLKLRLFTLLPDSVSKIIILDDRLRLLVDVHKIWKEFDKFDESQMIGVTKKGTENVYADIMLLNLDRMRKDKSLQSETEEILHSWDDAFAFFAGRSKKVYTLPCSLLVRVQKSFDTTKCLKGSEPEILWLDARSYNVFTGNPVVERKKLIVKSIEDSDGDVLRYSPDPCLKIKPSPPQKLPPDCQEFRHASTVKHRTHLYIYGQPFGRSSDPSDVTLVTQLTVNRFRVLERMVQQWDGPLHAVFSLTEEEGQRLLAMAEKSASLRKRENVAFHAVYRRGIFNPINYLRNVGINESKTAYTFFVDVDLVPNKNLYSNLKVYIDKFLKDKHAVLVVPAFESFIPLETYPDDKPTLLKLISNKSVEGYKMSRGWNLGHKPTDYPKWMKATEPYPAIFKDAFEPYVVIKTNEQIQFDERLLERMGDKTAHGRMLYAMGYELLILPDQYVIHLPHPTSTGTNMWKQYPGYGRCASVLFEEFRAETKKKYPKQKVH